MMNFDSITDVLKSDNGPVIAGLGAVVLLVGGHYVTKSRYRVEAKKESFTMEPAAGQLREPDPPAQAEETNPPVATENPTPPTATEK